MAKTVEEQLAKLPEPKARLREEVLRIQKDAVYIAEWLGLSEAEAPAVMKFFGSAGELHEMAEAIRTGSGFPVEFIFPPGFHN